ncbi:uncharacterized protein HD556DRAFT_684676 [Suillus plorans]|uniref:Secreted protein n=1 Tax=Suillus plorans TaxID=116603 RepID=A0A9P7AJA8_9AGAM|nr:uncharacterized protein HD556DRAFT_684676 [Suillus plorans]KAG1790630.1 hypothetical protein HD556DRAFT_684676 [Suillus plorans]
MSRLASSFFFFFFFPLLPHLTICQLCNGGQINSRQGLCSTLTCLRIGLGWTFFLPKYVLTSIWHEFTTLLEHLCWSRAGGFS